jgi:hypothetical protein
MWEPPNYTFPLFEKEEAQPTYCAYSLRFRAWALEMVRSFLEERDHTKINQAKVLLIDKYYEWKATIPAKHGKRHVCIADVKDEAYSIIRAAELALTPPQLYLPEPPKRTRKKKEPPPDEPVNTSILGELI